MTVRGLNIPLVTADRIQNCLDSEMLGSYEVVETENSRRRVLEQMRQDSLNVHEDDDSGAMWRGR